MNTEQEVISRAKEQIAAGDYTAAEQTLQQSISEQTPGIETYNCLMELYYHVEMYPKVIEVFKEASQKFPDLDLKSYFMIADYLSQANAVKEAELILLLAKQNYSENLPHVLDKLLQLYMHRDTPILVTFNFIKTNYNTLILPTELCIEIIQRLAAAKHSKELEEFFFFAFNTSMGDIHRKKTLLKEYIGLFTDPELILQFIDKLSNIGLPLEPAIYFTTSTYLQSIGHTTKAKEVIKLGITNTPESEVLFNEVLEQLADS